MKVVYASRTGNVRSFIEKLGVDNVLEIEDGTETVDEKYVLVTYTDGYGELPPEVETFLEHNADNLVAVAASGDTSYGDAYCLAADEVADRYGVPILLKFENDGTNEDVSDFLDQLENVK
ncbi:MAG TPA: class Ib ribonucleoside-diphosphate reductase assembly flavoprotein NrdI [Acholeplasmataceae bacterium]|jgi:protein involved in ribonucleotide reduction|nr:class Ib ribonucleoside-diphosphate reductase assembly flavoprotein NrdI [Acholeplasmataceae bacterium]